MDTKKFEEKLLKQKEELREILERFASEDDKPKGDWDTVFPKISGSNIEEAADEVEEYNSLLSVEHSLELKLKKTEEALERIKNDTYGKCQKCKKEISEKRLSLIPEAKNCKDCN